MRPYYQLLSYRLLKLIFRTINVRVPGRTLAVPCREKSSLAALFWKPSWKTQLIGHFLTQRAGVFLDIGANVGQTLFDHVASGVRSRYIGFEPNMSGALYLTRLIENNHLDQAAIVPIALGERASVLQLHRSSSHETDSSAFIHSFTRPNWTTRSDYISCQRLDDIAEGLAINQIGLCKIDVEGFELEVLRGMRDTLLTQRPPVLCEVLDADKDADMLSHAERLRQLENLLTEARYEIYRILKTADNQFFGLKKVREFESKRWESERNEECDYLFAHELDTLPDFVRAKIT